MLHRIKYIIVPGLIKGLHKKGNKASGKVFVVWFLNSECL